MPKRKVVVYEFMTLDGVVDDIGHFFTDLDDNETDADASADAIATQDAVILGRRTFDEWAGFWPTSTIEPFATFINAVPKFIATSSPLELEWAGATAIDGDLASFVRQLRDQPGGDIGVHASISVAQALLSAGLVDELRLIVVQTIVGAGRRLFDGLPQIQLEPIRSLVSPNGYLILVNRVVA